MTFEVMGTEVGVLRARDVRAVVGARHHGVVPVLVLGPIGEGPFVGTVTLTSKRSGYGNHLALECPACGCSKSILHVRSSTLSCTKCARTRTRRQQERTLASWQRGGREEDRLLRTVGRGASPDRLRSLVDELADGDTDRVEALLDVVHDVAVVVEQRRIENETADLASAAWVTEWEGWAALVDTQLRRDQ